MKFFLRHILYKTAFGLSIAVVLLCLLSLNAPEKWLNLIGSRPVAAAPVFDGHTPGPAVESTPNSTGSSSQLYYAYFPMVTNSTQIIVEILDAWTSDLEGNERVAFQTGAEMQYWVSGTNNFVEQTQVSLQWNQTGPCGASLVYSDTVTLDPGDWQHAYPYLAPDCSGVFTPTVQVDYKTQAPTLSTQFIVSQQPSTVLVSDQPGFDRCWRPDVDEMLTWWQSSPYRVFNLYVGGIHYYCRDLPLDAEWVRQVAEQGWTFIQTWVGPQAPCSGYTYKISSNTSTAYSQGRDEAQLAAEAANALGFTGENIIYYDMEGYPDEAACRNAVSSFMRGWVERLHELGHKAGGYGSACRSFITDWASNEPPPDDVWIAHWYGSTYDEDATVWDAPCVDNELWKDHQRIKQYTGGHTENWGGVSLVIDSDILDGEITTLISNPVSEAASTSGTLLRQYGAQIQDAGIFSQAHGWALVHERLLLTEDGGGHWRDITPAAGSALSAAFLDPQQAWVVSRTDRSAGLVVSLTGDGGLTWQTNPLPLARNDAASIASVSIDPLDLRAAWLVIKHQTGSSFSQGSLFFTDDGGNTWQERSLPLGDAVNFLDERRGWVAGGPGGDLLYRTQDGGHTWHRQDLATRAGERLSIGLPYFIDEQSGVLPVGIRSISGSKLTLYRSDDGGLNWSPAYSMPAAASFASTGALSGLLEVAMGEGERILEDILAPDVLPQGVISLNFLDHQRGWAVTQVGVCEGNKHSPFDEVLECEQIWKLLITDDGGSTWREIKF